MSCTCGSPSGSEGEVELSCVSVHDVLDVAVAEQRLDGLTGTPCVRTLLGQDTRGGG